MENWERDSEAEAKKKSKKAGREKKKKSKEDAEKKTDIGKARICGDCSGSAGSAMGMATGYPPRVSTEIFLCGVLGIMILGMLSFWLIKKIFQERTGSSGENIRKEKIL